MKKLFLVFFLFVFKSGASAFNILDEGKFLNFSDVHFDPFYDTTLVSDLIKSDYTDWEKLFSGSGITVYSRYESDSNFPLFRSSLEDMRTRLPRPDFIIITGDFISHNFNQNFQKYSGSKNTDSLNLFIEKSMRFVTSMIVKSYPDVLIFPILGNDDAYCGNYMVDPGGAFLKMLSDAWEPLVNKDGINENFKKDFRIGGYCSLNFPQSKDYKMIILNTIFFSKNYQNLCGDTLLDPGKDELKWLNDALEYCRNNDYKVWLSYHIPPGIDIYGTINSKGNCDEKIVTTWKSNYNKEFIGIINEYSSVINLSLAGHFHRDDFRVFYDNGFPVSFIHLSPSISPVYGNNPSYNIFSYDNSKYELFDYETCYLKNLAEPDSAHWELEYNFNQSYDQNLVNAQTMDYVSKLISSDSTYRKKYISFYEANNAKSFQDDYANWFYNWCGFGHLSKEDYIRCFCSDSSSVMH